MGRITKRDKETYSQIVDKRVYAAFEALQHSSHRTGFILGNAKNRCYAKQGIDISKGVKFWYPALGDFHFILLKCKTSKEAKQQADRLFKELEIKFEEYVSEHKT